MKNGWVAEATLEDEDIESGVDAWWKEDDDVPSSLSPPSPRISTSDKDRVIAVLRQTIAEQAGLIEELKRVLALTKAESDKELAHMSHKLAAVEARQLDTAQRLREHIAEVRRMRHMLE